MHSSLFLSSLTLLCLSDVTLARVHPQLQADTTSDGSADALHCTRARSQIVTALQDPHGDLHKVFTACTRPLLYLSYKWTNAEQAKAYCKSDKCKELVKKLKSFDACAWKDVPDDSDNDLLVAQRVLQDCV